MVESLAMQIRQKNNIMGWLWCYGVIVCLLWRPVMGTKCNIDPFTIEFENVTVIHSPKLISGPHKGMSWIFGGDQQLSMGFGTTANSTFVPDSTKLCNSTATDFNRCLFWRGGLYTPEHSDTWKKDKGTENFNGSVSNEGWDTLNAAKYKELGDDPLTSFTRGWDKVSVADKIIYSYPFSVIENSSFPFGTGMVGLATDSVFLKTLVETDVAPSRSWGFDYGRNGLGNETKGELVIGGYNSEKASYKDFANFTVFPDKNKPCPLQVNVKRMKMGKVDLMAGQQPFMACIEPAYWSMILPLKVQSNWNNTLQTDYANSFWKSTWEYYYFNQTANSSFPTDDIEIELDQGFTVSIPNNELTFPAVDIDNDSGGWIPYPDLGNGSTPIQTTFGTAGFPPGVEPDLYYLGGPFLSVAYLAVDYETMTFSVAKTKQTTKSNLVKFGCGASPPPPSNTGSSGNHNAAIIGGTIGGIAGLALIGILAWFLCFRKVNDQPPTVETAQVQPVGAIGPVKQEEDAMQYDQVPRYSSPISSYAGYPPPPESIMSATTFYDQSQQAWQLPAGREEGGGSTSHFVEAVEMEGNRELPSSPAPDLPPKIEK